MIAQFKSRYGIDVRMEVLAVPLEADFANQVNANYIQPRLAKQQYAYALADALRALWQELKAQETVQQDAPDEHDDNK